MKIAWICFKGLPAGFHFVDSPSIAPAHVLHVFPLTSFGSYLFVPLTSSVTRLFLPSNLNLVVEYERRILPEIKEKIRHL